MKDWVEITAQEYIKLFKSGKMTKVNETDDELEYKGSKGLKLKATNLRHYSKFFTNRSG